MSLHAIHARYHNPNLSHGKNAHHVGERLCTSCKQIYPHRLFGHTIRHSKSYADLLATSHNCSTCAVLRGGLRKGFATTLEAVVNWDDAKAVADLDRSIVENENSGTHSVRIRVRELSARSWLEVELYQHVRCYRDWWSLSGMFFST